MRGRQKLGEILVGLEVLSPRDVERVLEALRYRPRRHKFGEMARSMGLVGEEHILAALAVQMELFPGLQDLSLEQILAYLQAPEAAAL